MSDREAVESALARHDAFDRDDGGFGVRTTAVEGRVVVEVGSAGVLLRVTARVPTIDAVVAGETVSPVVQEGWFETFDRRVEDVGGVTRGEPREPVVTLDEAAGEVIVETAVEADRADRAVADAKAIVEYVEGTFVEGLIPGYTYREPAEGLLAQARATGDRPEGPG